MPRLRTILVLLLLGAVANVAAAWTLVARGRSRADGILYGYSTGPKAYQISRESSFGQETVTCCERTVSLIGTKPYPGRDWWLPPPPQDGTIVWQVTGAGWPMLGMKGWQAAKSFIPGSAWSTQWGIMFERSSDLVLLPVRPAWPGFPINTLIYAMLLYTLWVGPSFVRQQVRRRQRERRFQCLKCGYPRGDSSICSECGAAVKPLAATAPTHASPPSS